MLTFEGPKSVRPTVRAVQATHMTGILLLLGFLAAAIVFGPSMSKPVPPAAGGAPQVNAPAAASVDNFLTWFTLAFAGLVFIAFSVASRFMVAWLRRMLAAALDGPDEAQNDARGADKLSVAHFFLRTAPSMGATFFTVCAYRLGGHWIALVAAVILLIVTAARFPTRDRVEKYIERERENLFRARHALQ